MLILGCYWAFLGLLFLHLVLLIQHAESVCNMHTSAASLKTSVTVLERFSTSVKPRTTTCRGILGVATVVLALAGVEANPKRSFDDISSGLKNGHSTRTTTTHSSGHKIIKAEIHCRSDAYASAYSDWRSSYIKAGALLILTPHLDTPDPDEVLVL